MKRDEDDESEFDEGAAKKAGLQDFVRNAFMTGLGAMFMTEDTIRNFIRDKKLPREWTQELLSMASRRKDDFVGLIAKEAANFFQNMDFQKEVNSFFRNNTMKISAEISFHPQTSHKEDKRHG